MDGFFLFSSVSRRDSSFHPGWGPGVSAGTALCLPLYLTHTHTLTQKSNPPEPCFSEAPATAHEICLYHLVAVKVLVWTTVSASGPQSIKQKTEGDKDRENRVIVMLYIRSLCLKTYLKETSLSPLMLFFPHHFLCSSPHFTSSCSLLLPSLNPCGSAPLSASAGCQFLMIIW